jgi:mRNA interferase MazF
MNPLPGEVWQVDLGLEAKSRPVIIVSRDDPDAPRVLWIYVPVTMQYRGSRYEVMLPRVNFLRYGSSANAQGIGSGLRDDFKRKLGKLSPDVLKQVREALLFAVEMN